MIETRNWIHLESPEGVPSASAARLGCKCPECKEALREYLRAYRARRVAEKERADGTAVYHSHIGQPSKKTARKHLCIHPRCLDLAGLVLVEGVIRDRVTGAPDKTFGAVVKAAA